MYDSDDREPLDIEAILRHYGSDFMGGSGKSWQSIHCPFHNDRRNSAVVSTDRGVFKCFACDIQGDAISVIRKVENVDYPGAARLYETWAGRSVPPLPQSAFRFSGRRISSERPRSYEIGSGFFPSWFRGDTPDG